MYSINSDFEKKRGRYLKDSIDRHTAEELAKFMTKNCDYASMNLLHAFLFFSSLRQANPALCNYCGPSGKDSLLGGSKGAISAHEISMRYIYNY